MKMEFFDKDWIRKDVCWYCRKEKKVVLLYTICGNCCATMVSKICKDCLEKLKREIEEVLKELE